MFDNLLDYDKFLTIYSKNVIASKTDLKGSITYVSEAFSDISGYSSEELLGKNHNIVRHPDMPKKVFEELWKTIKSGKTFTGEIKNKKKNGDYYWVEATISPELDIDDNIIGYSAIRHDITQKKEFERLNKEHNKLLDAYSQYVIASKTDLAGIITYVSDAFCKISGYSREELLGASHNIVRHPDMSSVVFKKLWSVIQSGNVYFGEIKNKKKNGDYYWVEVAISPELDEHKNIVGYSAIRHNISQRKIVEELMDTDHLTRIRNRKYYDSHIVKEIDKVKRYNHKMSLMILDIDNFKKINDTYGHDIGDSVLIELCRLIESIIRKSDTFCRIGGEEFVISCPNFSYEHLYEFANKIIESVQKHNFYIVKDVTLSIGIAICNVDDDKNSLFKKADEALYKSKENGKNQVNIAE